MPVSRPRVARSRRRVGQPQGCEEPASTSRPFVGLMRGWLFSSRRTHSLGHGEDSRLCPPHPQLTHPRPCRHTQQQQQQQQHTQKCCRCPIPFHPPGLWPPWLSGSGWSGCARGPSRRAREGVWGAAEITCQPGEHLHTLTCHCFPPNKVQSSGAAFREPPRIPRIPSPRQTFCPSARVGHDSCSYPGLACPQNLPVSASSGQNLGEPNPSVSASGQSGRPPGLSIQLFPSRIGDGSISGGTAI